MDPRLTLLVKAVHFLTEPLDCTENPTARRLRAAATAWGRWTTVPWAQPLSDAVCDLACDLRLRPALVLPLLVAVFIVLVVTFRNACVNLWRWYAASRGSAFVAVATRALRELHASGALFEVAGGSADSTAASTVVATLGPRPAAAHRWYIPQALTAPVVCCGCFQPVVAAQGAEGHAQCCELCGMVAHASCVKAVPHSCRLLALPAPLPQDSPPPPPPPLPHDWRPAGTTLDLILPPADAEMLLGGGVNGFAAVGVNGSSTLASVCPSSHGPSSLCLYCGEPCEVGLLAVEPVWRCGGCRRFAHVQCWSSLHPGTLSAATRGALEGQAWEAEEITGSPRGTSLPWEPPANGAAAHDGGGDGGGSGEPPMGYATASEPSRLRGVGTVATSTSTAAAAGRSGGGAEQARAHGSSARALHPVAAPGGSGAPKPAADGRAGGAAGSGGGGGGGGKGARTPAAAAAATGAPAAGGSWDRNRRCQSLPNIAGAGPCGGSRGSAGGAGGRGGEANHHHHLRQSGSRVPGGGAADGAASTSPPRAQTSPPAGSGSGSGPGPCEAADGVALGAAGAAAAAAAAAPVRWPPGDSGRLPRLDRCDPQASLGALGAMVLPPTAVIPTNRRTSIFTPAAGKPAAAAAAAAAPAPSSAAAAAAPGASAAVTPNGNGNAAGGGGGRGGGRRKQGQGQGQGSLRQRAQKWYRSHAAGWSLTSGAAADAAAPERWRHFRLAPQLLPPGCKPALVFINPRSGPQAGEHLRRQLLQLLHPLQVVDLVREGPGAALRCWWGVPGLRVLVVGGDGTAGWVLGEMEAVAAELAAAAAAAQQQQQQQLGGSGAGSGEADNSGVGATATAMVGRTAVVAPPPPVAVLPLGTGNDLARVLGWGGGLAALDARGGVAAVLGEVSTSAPTPLDRWALSIATAPPEPVRRRSSFLPRRRQSAGAAAAAAAAKSPPLPPVVQIKMFNNYLGVGIDSWCALEFHRMRERYPGWFKSQLGNKMWYTGVGARDLLARSCVNLPTRLQLVCDGLPVELPPSAQGLLLLNIPSYMGGVDLWGNGVSLQQQQQQQFHMQQLNGTVSAPPLALRDGAAGPEPHSPERPAGPHPAATAAAGGTNTAAAVAPAPPNNGTQAAARRGGSGGSPLAASAPSAGGRVSCEATSQSTPSQSTPPPQQHQQQQQQPQHHAPHPGHPEVPQSISDGVLEVVVVFGAVHLGQLQVGLARATRLCQCRTAVITTRQALPMQVDGEPWMQPAAQMTVSVKGRSLVLRRLDLSSAASRLTAAVGEVLDGAVARGTISAAQRQALGAELAQRLGAPHAV